MVPTLRLPVCLALISPVCVGLGRPKPQTAAAPSESESGAKARSARAAVWTQFEMNRKDAAGSCLWTAPENWTQGLPRAGLSVEIGDDHSGKALHCVIPSGYDAICEHFELAEHAATQGTTLRLQGGATLTIRQSGVLSKDRQSRFYVDGTLRCEKARSTLRVGGPWGRPDLGQPACCHLLIGSTGVVSAWFVGINTDYRAESVPSTPWGPRFFARSTDSQIVVDGGKLAARQGLRISSSDSARPGALRLRGSAQLTSRHDSADGIHVWCGVWEIHGGQAQIRVGDVEFWGNKFKDAVNTLTDARVGAGLAVLKLSGNGVSTIRARNVSFVDAAVLDVGSLKVPKGTYTVIDATAIRQTNLRFARHTDTGKWSLRLDRAKGDVTLTFRP